jgi:hypothetical protein
LDQINAEWLSNPSKFEWLGKMSIREVEEFCKQDALIEQDLENHFNGIDQINAELNSHIEQDLEQHFKGIDQINAEFELQRS